MTSGKTIVITGANAGIGLATAELLAAKGYNIITICRDATKGAETVAKLRAINPGIDAENFVADLSDLTAVNVAADAILAKYSVIDRLINNAGYYPGVIEYIGDIEKTFYASHLGHMLLTRRLMPSLEKSKEARVINVSSALHVQGSAARFFKRINGLTSGQAYADAKLANILFTMELSKRLQKHVTTYSLHPGVVSTNFAKGTSGIFSTIINIMRPFFLSPGKGAATSVYLASVESEKIISQRGRYFAKMKPSPTRNSDLTDQNAFALWNRSEEVLKPFLK